MIRVALVVSLLSTSVAHAEGGEDALKKAAVIGFKATGVEEDVAANLVDLFTAEAGKIPGHKIIGQSEIQDTVGFAAQQNMLGCDDDAKCISDFAGALGADLLVTGRVGKVGETFVVSMQLIDVQKKEAVNRTGETIGGRVDLLLDYIRVGAWQLFSVEPPDEVVEKYQSNLAKDANGTTEVQASASVSPVRDEPAAKQAFAPNGPMWAITARKASTVLAVLGIGAGTGLLLASKFLVQDTLNEGTDVEGRTIYTRDDGNAQNTGRRAETMQRWSMIGYSVGAVGLVGYIVFKIMEPDNLPASSASIIPAPGGFSVRF